MTAIARCEKCEGVAPQASVACAITVNVVGTMLRELKRHGVPAELLQPIKTWADTTFKRCSCPRELFSFSL